MYAVHDVAIHTDSKEISQTSLTSPFPDFYKPTWREFFDSIARQTKSSWKYDPKRDYWVFAKPAMPVPFTVKLAKGWKSEDRGSYVFHGPPSAPVGMDVYVMGTYSALEKESTLFTKVQEDIALRFARSFKNDVTTKEMSKVKVGKCDALHFKISAPRTGIIWRQWIVVDSAVAIAIVSAVTPEHEKQILPDVEEMLKSFALRTADRYVSCQATLLKYDEEYQWFDNHEDGHDDGVAPRATFKITKPATYSHRKVSILFKSQHFENMLPTLKQGVGKPFLIEVPEDFLKGKANIIEALDVASLSSYKPPRVTGPHTKDTTHLNELAAPNRSQEVIKSEDGEDRHGVIKSNGLIVKKHGFTAHGEAERTWVSITENGDKPGIALVLTEKAGTVTSGKLYILAPNHPRDLSKSSKGYTLTNVRHEGKMITGDVSVIDRSSKTDTKDMHLTITLKEAFDGDRVQAEVQEGSSEKQPIVFVREKGGHQ